MLKQVMNNNNAKFYILLCILYVTQLCQSKVAQRRDDGDGTNAEQGNLVAVDDAAGQPIEDNDPEGSPLNQIAANAPEETAANGPEEIAANGPEEIAANGPEEIAGNGPEGRHLNPITPDGLKQNQPDSDKDEGPQGNLPGPVKSLGPQENLPGPGPVKSLDSDIGVEKRPNRITNDDKNKKKTVLDDGENQNGCWISLKEQSYFQKISQLEQKYKNAKEAYVRNTDVQLLNGRMVEAMITARGIAERALQNFKGDPNVIPAGLNLGSYCMMRMRGSMLFFYRLKLRNDTRFTVDYIYNDLDQLTLTLRLSLNDLHLVGEYERALTSQEDPSKLYYRPNKGEIEFFLKDVKYKVEGRYRLMDGKLHVEHIISEIPPMYILMRYTADKENKSTPLNPGSLSDYLKRMQTDLDDWLKDYFNDFLLLYGTYELKKSNEVQEFENEKTILLNNYADQVMGILNNRLREKGPNLMMPNFLLTAANGMEIRLYDGAVRGLDSMYRRSVATSKSSGDVRYVDADIGFSKLKAEYRYDVYVKTGVPPLSGVFVLNSDDVIAHMALQLVGYKPSVPDLLITYMRHGKPVSLTIEGPASRIIANFKHLLEHHIITIMSSTLIHHIRYLSALTKCEPQLPVIDADESKEDNKETDDRVTTEDYVDITTAMKPDDDESTEPPVNNDATPTESPEDKSDDDSNNDNTRYHPGKGVTIEPPDDDDVDAGTTEQPNPKNNDDNTRYHPGKGVTIEPPDDDDVDAGTTEQPNPKNNDDNTRYHPGKGVTIEPPDDDDVDAGTTEQPNPNTNNKKPEYAFVRKESVELELPPKDGAAQGQSYKLDHNETFSLTKLNNNNNNDD